jgi:hypothetical protein
MKLLCETSNSVLLCLSLQDNCIRIFIPEDFVDNECACVFYRKLPAILSGHVTL